MRLLKISAFVALLVQLLVACNTKQAVIMRGVISYNIEYPDFDSEKNRLTFMLLPKTQNLYFKPDSIHSQIKKAMVEMNLYSATLQEEMLSEFIFNKSLQCNLDEKDKKEMLRANGKYEIIGTEVNDTLLGFNCKKIEAKLPDGDIVEVLYTNEIGIENSNWFNPYRDIDGVLLQYAIISNGMKMTFKANKFDKNLKPSHRFEFNKKGVAVSYLEMEEQIAAMFKDFVN